MTPLPRQPRWLKKLKWTTCKPDFLEIYSTKFKHCCNLYFVQIFSSVHSSWNDPFLALIGRGTTTLYGPMSTVVLPGLNNPRLIEYVVAPLGATQGKASRDFWRTGAFLRCFIPKTMFTDYLGSPTWNKEAHACGLECLDLGFFEDIHSIRNLGRNHQLSHWQKARHAASLIRVFGHIHFFRPDSWAQFAWNVAFV